MYIVTVCFTFLYVITVVMVFILIFYAFKGEDRANRA